MTNTTTNQATNIHLLSNTIIHNSKIAFAARPMASRGGASLDSMQNFDRKISTVVLYWIL